MFFEACLYELAVRTKEAFFYKAFAYILLISLLKKCIGKSTVKLFYKENIFKKVFFYILFPFYYIE